MKVGISEEFDCPRRAEHPASYARFPGPDHWRDDDTCSYCGGFKPDICLQMVENSRIELGPTDKDYKAYIKFLIASDEGRYHYQRNLYFQHLSRAERQWFIKLYNSGKMKLGYPGAFYVKPYFVRLDTEAKRITPTRTVIK